jgi:hypothetical protein
MGEFAIGQSVLRREDPRLLQGHTRRRTGVKVVWVGALIRANWAIVVDHSIGA